MIPRILGLPGSGAWGWLARCLLSGTPIPGVSLKSSDGKLILVLKDQSELEDVADAFEALAPMSAGAPPGLAVFGEDIQARLASLERLRRGARLALATPEALSDPIADPSDFEKLSVTFKRGARGPRADSLAALERGGYRRADFVESPGEYAVRGAVLDFYGLEPLRAVRVLYDEDVIESLRVFDPQSQRTSDFLEEASAIAALASAGAPLRDWFKADWLGVLGEGVEPVWAEGTAVYRGGGLSDEAPGEADFGAKAHIPFLGRPEIAWGEMRRLAGEGYRIVHFALNHGEDQRVQELLEGKLEEGACQFLTGPLRRGFIHPPGKLAVFCASEIFARNYRSASRWKYFSSSSRNSLRRAELRLGDTVVHQDYGLARYRGLKPVESHGSGTTDCLVLEFRGSDALYIPMTDFRRIQRYSGAEGHRPRLSSLDTRRWEEIRHSVREGVRELAEKLLKMDAKRKATPGFAFPASNEMEREFAEAFPFEETPDQTRAIAEVLADMQSPHPMDRLVVGDVGFGKTEVAMRAAFKCVLGYKQAAVLVPTTILADQHWRTFKARFADYPVRIGILSRFQSAGEQKNTLTALAAGTLDIVIGTSRLLQKDVKFKDIGLTVIDEEHRFGVRDKERLKAFRATVDCLALSATPIPRTLNQAFSGFKGISLIQSAPMGRQPIVTRVLPYDINRAVDAISEELDRGGQVYYVHNRVRTLPSCLKSLKERLPLARFCMVHGQMKGPEIEKVMWEFFNRQYDVLVASSIIESGLDIPSVNGLLIEDAHDFGLAQLYQLRGRIGREKQRAHCTLFYPAPRGEDPALTPEAAKRLEALKEFGELGSGMRLALRDLEIRGAGDILGDKQHGFMKAVGVDYYTQLLNEEISTRTGRPTSDEGRPVTLDLGLTAYIPESILPGEIERLEFYKRMLRSKPEEIPSLRAELEELSGPLPPPALQLFELLGVRALAEAAGLRSLIGSGRKMTAEFYADAGVSPNVLQRWSKAYEGRYRLLSSPAGDGIAVELTPGERPLDWSRAFLGELLAPAGKMLS